MPETTRPAFINCSQCGQPAAVGKRGPLPKYCSQKCRDVSTRDAYALANCMVCGTPVGSRTGTRYCSPRCRQDARRNRELRDGRYDAQLAMARQRTLQRRKAAARPCPYCEEPMLNPQRKQCGKPDCKRAFNAERMRKWQQEYQAEHGQWYRQVNYAEQQREYNRQRREELGHWRKLYPERAALTDARRRMRLEQARTAERFAPLDVHTRDGWTCRLCGLPIDPEVAWPDPMSASVDHIVPLSRGGSHSMINVQSAHLGCNSRKCDRLAGDQPSRDQGSDLGECP